MTWKRNILELVSCDCCGNDKAKHVFTRPDGMDVVECSDCALCFLNPRPQANFIARLYDADYFQKPSGESNIGFIDYADDCNRELRLQCALGRFQLISANLDLKQMEVLEIGCSTGEFCHLLSGKVNHVVGLDLSTTIVSLARKRYEGIDFRSGDIAEIPARETFDCIFAFEVLEHLTSPGQFMAEVRARLRPGGWLILSTPNYDCGKKIGLDLWSGFQGSFEHLYFFSVESLAKYAFGTGMKIDRWFTGGGSGLVNQRDNAGKWLARKALAKSGLLRIARRLRRPLIRHDYVQNGESHNLFAFFRRL